MAFFTTTADNRILADGKPIAGPYATRAEAHAEERRLWLEQQASAPEPAPAYHAPHCNGVWCTPRCRPFG